MNIYLQVDHEKLIDISDIKNENHNLECKANTPEEVYELIREYDYDDSSVEDFVKSIFSNEENNENLSSYKIKHWVSNRSYGELIDMYNNDEIIVPHMQRNFVWNSIMCSRLIESIILGLPIPPLFLLEISDNKYELIDGFQRLTALANYVGGRQWNYNEKVNNKVIASKLSSKVASEIAGKSYENLEEEYQRKIKRSTIPLIEFKQLEPNNYDAKYLIFERINTGSVKLNPMQIRKSLSYGEFIKSLYRGLETITPLNNIFSIISIKKDNHIEAVLRTVCFYDFIYKNEFKPKTKGIKNILNEYCEFRKDKPIEEDEFKLINKGLELLSNTFEKGELFKKVETQEDGTEMFTGNLNISIFESLLGSVMREISNNQEINKNKLYNNYKKQMIKNTNEGITKNINPFSISTGTIESIKQRFKICEQIVRHSLL